MEGFTIRKDGSVVIPYRDRELPLAARTLVDKEPGQVVDDPGSFPSWFAMPHWHPDIEVFRMLEGRMAFWVNSRTLVLEEGDCLVLNTLRMHCHASKEGLCRVAAVHFSADLLAASPALRERYVEPLLAEDAFDFLHLKAGSDEARRLAHKVDRLLELQREREPACGLRSLGILESLWADVFTLCSERGAEPSAGPDRDLATAKIMVSFIQRNHARKIAHEDIAKAGQVCRSTCTRIFKECFDQTPVEFLNRYRLESAKKMLAQTDRTVSEVAALCGFQYQSYFCSTFKKAYGMTPKEFRQRSASHAKDPEALRG